MFATSAARLHVALTIEDAVAALADAGSEGAALAGGTWLMRAPIRGEPAAGLYVALSRIPELQRIDVQDDLIVVGAAATHTRIAAALGSHPECVGLVTAVLKGANPAVRHMATIGGNLSCSRFAASDVIPALLCLDAEVELRSRAGRERVPLGAFLARRDALPAGTLLTHVRFTRRPARFAHARLPLRRAGDYPVAIVSASAEMADDGRVKDLRLAVGSVEQVARRWESLEAFARGQPLDENGLGGAAEHYRADFTGRDGVEAEGWYRTQVLPTLVRRAVRSLSQSA